MKFEKFLKSVGTHGEVITINESEKWLICDGVGMVSPRGVDNLLGSAKAEEYASIVHAFSNVDYDDPLELVQAVLLDPTANAKGIYRVFETDMGDTVGICNADYGLLEKSDKLCYCEIEIPPTEETEAHTVKYVLVYDEMDSLRGFITGSDKF